MWKIVVLGKHVLKEGKKTGEKEGRDGWGEDREGRREGGREKQGKREARGLAGSVEYHLENMDCVS